VWHASIARVSARAKIVPTDRWGDGVRREARRRLDVALHGVGNGESVEMWRPVCLHLRRGLSDDEMRLLSAEWLAIPARDEFSEDGAIEPRL
jgi:hypothetical protein